MPTQNKQLDIYQKQVTHSSSNTPVRKQGSTVIYPSHFPFPLTETFLEIFNPSELHMEIERMVNSFKAIIYFKTTVPFFSEYLKNQINQIKVNLHHVWLCLIDITTLLFIITIL